MINWPLDSVHYPGTVRNLHQDGNVTVLYDDGMTERLDMNNEIWHYETTGTLSACTSNTQPLEKPGHNIIQNELQKALNYFGNKQFMKQQGQCLEQQYILANAYNAEEESFLKTVTVLPLSKNTDQC